MHQANAACFYGLPWPNASNYRVSVNGTLQLEKKTIFLAFRFKCLTQCYTNNKRDWDYLSE